MLPTSSALTGRPCRAVLTAVGHPHSIVDIPPGKRIAPLQRPLHPSPPKRRWSKCVVVRLESCALRADQQLWTHPSQQLRTLACRLLVITGKNKVARNCVVIFFLLRVTKNLDSPFAHLVHSRTHSCCLKLMPFN